MPDIAGFISDVLKRGEFEVVYGQRHYTDQPMLGWSQSKGPLTAPVYHAYGFGGAGLTLAPAIARHITGEVNALIDRDSPETTEVVILGAGYTGIMTALALRQAWEEQRQKPVAIRVVADSFTYGISRIAPWMREPQLADNFSSQIGSGWIMPVSVAPLADKKLWCQLIKESQHFWEEQSEKLPLGQSVRKTTSLIFYDPLESQQSVLEDKSGIRTVLEQCPDAPYQQISAPKTFSGTPLNPSRREPDQTTLQYHKVLAFDNIIQLDTRTVLAHYSNKLLEKGVELIQLSQPVASTEELSSMLTPGAKSIVINASGHGACNLFGCTPSRPIRGDLVLLRLPLEYVSDAMKQASNYGFWAKGSHYLFPRYPVSGDYLELVLGATFLENDTDLSLRPDVVRSLLRFWMNFTHTGQKRLLSTREQLKIDNLINQLLEKIPSDK